MSSVYPSQQRASLPPVFGLLDVGTAKIVCLMLAREKSGGLKLIGVGHQKSRGLKASVVVDVDAAEEAVRATIAQAEDMAGESLGDVIVAAACGRMTSMHVAATLELGGRAVSPADMDDLLDAGRQYAERDDRAALHVNPVSARLDGAVLPGGILGHSGQHLSLDVNAVAADRGPLRHLLHLIERCQLQVLAIAPAPLASGLAVTNEAERQRGALIIDFGAGTTGIALFLEGALVAVHVIPIGSNHMTYDLSRALGTSLEEAERIKKNCAILGLAHTALDDTITCQIRCDDHADIQQVHTKTVARADISTILTSRADALFLQVLQRLEPLALAPQQFGEAVLTGGGSLLAGFAAHASRSLGLPVRQGAPLSHGTLPAALRQAALSTAAGLEAVATHSKLGLRLDPAPLRSRTSAGGGGWARPSL